MAGRSGDGVELNVFVLRRALHDSIEAEESLEQGKLEFRDAKSGSVSSWAKRREGGEGGVWTRWVEDEGRKPRKTRRNGGYGGGERARHPRKEYLLPSSLPLTHRFPARTCKHLLTI